MASTESSTSRMIGLADFGALDRAAARRVLARVWRIRGASKGLGRFFIRWNARHDATRRSSVDGAGQASDFPQPLDDQRLCGRFGTVLWVCQVAGMIEDKTQRHVFTFGPGQRVSESRSFPCSELEQIPFVSAQRVGRCAAEIKVRQRCLIRCGEGRGQHCRQDVMGNICVVFGAKSMKIKRNDN